MLFPNLNLNFNKCKKRRDLYINTYSIQAPSNEILYRDQDVITSKLLNSYRAKDNRELKVI